MARDSSGIAKCLGRSGVGGDFNVLRFDATASGGKFYAGVVVATGGVGAVVVY